MSARDTRSRCACPTGDRDGDAAAIRAAFDAEYARFYDRPVPGSDVEVMSYAVSVATEALVQADPAPATRPAGPPRSQPVRDPVSGAVADWPVHDRAALPPGSTVHGPGHHRGGRDVHPGRRRVDGGGR